MYGLVTKYFAQCEHIALPGIGNFSVETNPARVHLTSRSITSPQKKIVFTNDKNPPPKKFYTFLASEYKTDEVQAARLFKDFTARLQEELNKKNNIYFKGIGTLSKQTSNVIIFHPEEMPGYLPELPAERIIRKNIAHTVRVGEQEKTSEEMQSALTQPRAQKKERWWIAAAVLAAIGVSAIIFYYMNH